MSSRLCLVLATLAGTAASAEEISSTRPPPFGFSVGGGGAVSRTGDEPKSAAFFVEATFWPNALLGNGPVPALSLGLDWATFHRSELYAYGELSVLLGLNVGAGAGYLRAADGTGAPAVHLFFGLPLPLDPELRAEKPKRGVQFYVEPYVRPIFAFGADPHTRVELGMMIKFGSLRF